MKPLRRLRALLNNQQSSPLETGKDANQDPTGIKMYRVVPQLTDTSINKWTADHYIALPSPNQQRNRLLLFLSGSFGSPKNQTLLIQVAARLGYHAINLSYPNSWTVAGLCRRSTDANCHEHTRLSILDGVQRSNDFKVSSANSVYNRLNKLLVYLIQQHPNENWDTYMAGQTPIWEKIVVAGHSQGGGHAALIAQTHTVSRCIMFGAPADFNPILKSPAPWLSNPSATPAERYYGFAHRQDKAIKRILFAWKLLGMAQFGPPVDSDRSSADYQQSHQLITNAIPNKAGKYHSCVVVDASIPTQVNGKPIFEPIWQYMLTS